VLDDHPYRPLADFLGKPRSACHDSILSTNGVSGNPGAIHLAGTYTVTLKVFDSLGQSSDLDFIYITVTDPTPVPSISFGGFVLLAGLMIGSAMWLIRRQRIASA
jgi:hypothetical protein